MREERSAFLTSVIEQLSQDFAFLDARFTAP